MLTVVGVLALASVVFGGNAPTTPSAAVVWPMPVDFSQGSTSLSLSPSEFSFACASGSPCPMVLTNAFKRYMPVLFPNSPSRPSSERVPLHPEGYGAVSKCEVSVTKDVVLEMGVDESYNVSVTADGKCELAAATQWGALRALETFAQLVWWDRTTPDTYLLLNAPIMIQDAPRFAHRGLLVDTARHFQPVETLVKILDGMAAMKMNVFHWHVVDDESWPLISKTYPQFSLAGAYAPWETYSQADQQRIKDEADARGITIMLEFDTPAHATIWGAGYPNLTISCNDGQTLVNPTGDIYTVFQGLLDEFTTVFNTSSLLHIGGDEVHDFTCWNESAEVHAFMEKEGLSTMWDVRNYYESKIQSIVAGVGLRSVAWEEVFDGNYTLRDDTIVNIWLGPSETKKAVQRGKVILSASYYLDQENPTGGKSHYLWLDTALDFFSSEPLTGLSPEAEANITGIEASQWGEQLYPLSIFSRIFPRASATAYRAWSPQSYTDQNSALVNITVFSCRLRQRGFITSPLRPAIDNVLCSMPENSTEVLFAKVDSWE